MDYTTYQAAAVDSLADLYGRTKAVFPDLLAALIVLILGWVLGSFLNTVVTKLLEMVQIDHLANQLGLKNLSEKVGRKLSLAAFGGWLVKWFFFLGSFIAAADILHLQGVSTFLYQDVLGYAGQVVIAMAILLLGILAANFFSNLVSAAVKASGLHRGDVLANITKWAIVVFTILTVLSKLGVDDYLKELYKAIILMLAVAGGLAFGLGGKEHASKILDKIEQNLK